MFTQLSNNFELLISEYRIAHVYEIRYVIRNLQTFFDYDLRADRQLLFLFFTSHILLQITRDCLIFCAYSLNLIFFCIQMCICAENNKFTFLFLFIFSQNYLSIDSSYPPTTPHTNASVRGSYSTIYIAYTYVFDPNGSIYLYIYI